MIGHPVSKSHLTSSNEPRHSLAFHYWPKSVAPRMMMIDMGLFLKCCSVVTILPQILSLNTLVCVLPLSIRTSQLNQLNKAIRVFLTLVFYTDHLILGRVGWGGESTEVPWNHTFLNIQNHAFVKKKEKRR